MTGGPADGAARCVVHIGLPKTGTTTLQTHLFPSHSEIAYLGKTMGAGTKLYEPDVHELVRIIRRGDEQASRSSSARATAQGVLDQATAASRVLVLSDEGIVSIGAERRGPTARCIRNLFGPCHVLVVLRRPVEIAESLYIQKMVWPQGPVPRAMGSVWWRTIDEWLDEQRGRPDNGTLSNLGYADAVRHYSDVLGKGAVGVFLLERLREEPTAYYASMLKFLGVNVDEGLRLVSRQQENIRLTQRQFDDLRNRCRAPLSGFILRNGPRILRKRIMASVRAPDPADDSGKARAPMSPAQAARIDEESRAGHRWLVKEFGLPLERYGYAL